MREVGHFRQPHPEPALSRRRSPAARRARSAGRRCRARPGRRWSSRASGPSSRRSSTSSLTSGRALPTEIVTSIGTPRKAPARAWRAAPRSGGRGLGVRRGLIRSRVIVLALALARSEMRRDAGADLRDAGVEIEMVVALVPEDLRLPRQELRRLLDDGVEAHLRQHRAEPLGDLGGAAQPRAGRGGLDQRPLDDPARSRRRARRRPAPGRPPPPSASTIGREARGDVAARGLVGQPRVVDRLDELGGQPPLLLEEAVGGRGLPFEVALGIGLLARRLDAARQRRPAGSRARRRAGTSPGDRRS